MTMPKTYTISELAEEFGVSTRTLRHYEDQGLVTPARQGLQHMKVGMAPTQQHQALHGRSVRSCSQPRP